MAWFKKIATNILPLSKESYNAHKALKEWEYRGDIYDLKNAYGRCDLCGNFGVRYQFKIINKYTKKHLWVGSECISNFKIKVITDSGEKIQGEKAKKQVRKDKRKVIINAKAKDVLNALLRLSSKDKEFDIEGFINYYQQRGAFTPQQLLTIFWRFKKYNIYFKKKSFKLTIKKKKEREQLLSYDDWQIKKIYPCLSNYQKKLLIEERKSKKNKK
ncbi:MAG: hypothetical protein ACOCQR_00275 [bacterium]